MEYAGILKKYHSQILLEVSGHDHIGDLRFSDQVFSPDKDGAYAFHNILIAPSMTMSSDTQPGFTLFKIDKDTLLTRDLNMIFMPIEQTFSRDITIDSKFLFRVFDFQRFGLKDLSVESVQKLLRNLSADSKLLVKYLIMKRGFDPDKPSEYQLAVKLY